MRARGRERPPTFTIIFARLFCPAVFNIAAESRGIEEKTRVKFSPRRDGILFIGGWDIFSGLERTVLFLGELMSAGWLFARLAVDDVLNTFFRRDLYSFSA